MESSFLPTFTRKQDNYWAIKWELRKNLSGRVDKISLLDKGNPLITGYTKNIFSQADKLSIDSEYPVQLPIAEQQLFEVPDDKLFQYLYKIRRNPAQLSDPVLTIEEIEVIKDEIDNFFSKYRIFSSFRIIDENAVTSSVVASSTFGLFLGIIDAKHIFTLLLCDED